MPSADGMRTGFRRKQGDTAAAEATGLDPSGCEISFPPPGAVAGGLETIENAPMRRFGATPCVHVLRLHGSTVCGRRVRAILSACWLILATWLVISDGVRAQSYEAVARTSHRVGDSFRNKVVVGRREAEESASGTVGEILERAPGVLVQRTSSSSGAPIVRGLTGHRVLLMLDGMRLNDALMRVGGNALLNLVDPESIERIEVVRGPASVAYGSDALGGLVRVVTKRTPAEGRGPSGVRGSAFARGSSAEHAGRVRGSLSGWMGPFGARVSAGVGRAGLVRRGGSMGLQPFTGYRERTLSARLEFVPQRTRRVSLSYQSNGLFDSPRADVSTAQDQQLVKSLTRDAFAATYVSRLPGSRVRLHVHAGISLRAEWRQRLRTDRIENQRDRVLSWQPSIALRGSPWKLASLEVGMNAVIDQIGSSGLVSASGSTKRVRGRYVDGSNSGAYGAYMLLSQSLGSDALLLAGFRGTYLHVSAPADRLLEIEPAAVDPFDRRMRGVTGSLGVRHELGENLAWVGNLLVGFRAPNLEDFQALGSGARGFTVPSPQLDVERSWTAETGFKFKADDWSWDAYLYGSLLTGLIVRVPSSYLGRSRIEGLPVLARRNASRAVLIGAELSLQRHWTPQLTTALSVWETYGQTQRPELNGTTSSEPASKIPPPMLLASVRYGERTEGRWWISSAFAGALSQTRLSRSDRQDIRICAKGRCDGARGWIDVTLSGGLRLGNNLSFTVSVENLLDAGYKTFASAVYSPGRNVVAVLRANY